MRKEDYLNFPKYKMVDGRRYGPTRQNHYYQPAWYHNPIDATNNKGKKAKQKEHEDKTHWVLDKPKQYHVFRIADENKIKDNRGIYSVLDKLVLGENGQILAFFKEPGNDTWHGYPVFTWEEPVSEALLKKMTKKGMISEITKQRLLDGRL